MTALGWSTAFRLISLLVGVSEIGCHSEHDDETETLESDIDGCTLFELRSFGFRESSISTIAIQQEVCQTYKNAAARERH